MANPKEELPEVLRYIPWWRKGDPGPDWPWFIREINAEAAIQLAVSQLHYENDVAQATIKANERNIKILTAAKKQ